MKKIVVILFVAVGLFSCSSGDDNTESGDIEWGQYVYSDNKYVVSINAPSNGEITIYENGKCVFQQLTGITFNIIETNEYYHFGWAYDGLTLTVKHSTKSSFKATVDENTLQISLPNTMQFKLNNTVLDADSDGILD